MGNDFPAGWLVAPLEDCMSAIIDYRGITPKKSSAGIPLITAKIVKGGRILDVEEFIPAEDYQAWMRRGLPEPGDVVMTMEAPLGEVAQLDDRKVALAQRLITLRGRPDLLDNAYLKFLMQSEFIQDQLAARSTGTTVTGIKQSELRKVQLVLPPLPEQRGIGKILGALDDKIELNRHVNATLEALARALFQSWFVDFDPVRARAEWRQPAGMDAATAALFPDRFEDSALGEVPQGWQVTQLGNAAEINRQSITADFPYEEIDYIDIASVSEGRLESPTTFQITNAPGRARRLVRHGDTIWSTVRPNRRSFLFIHDPKPNLVVSTGFAVLSPTTVPPSYLHAWVTTDEFVEYLVANADGSAYPAVLSARFGEAPLLLPPANVLDAFHALAGPMRDRIEHNWRENVTLANLRDTLLPKLMSGEVRVSTF